ncbi:ECF transporter S component [Kocuria rosea]|uniref:ECF transporter S component n=1 Tax=Kocuria rosea TaxID=1275 RepID=UPI00203C7FE5|nr:ECF transporter S component [Kocuria rosea]MCM3686413.1 ECF transporter S component [Kocuria rosea]
MNTTTHRPAPRASRQRSWRVVDIVVAAVLAAVCAVVFWAWSNLLYPLISTASVAYPPSVGLIAGGWLVAGGLGGLVIRKPGAALFVELLAAVIEGFLGTHFGWLVVLSGLLQGIGAELAFAAFRYRRFDALAAAAAGAVSGIFLGVNENILYNYEWAFSHQVVYVVLAAVSGAVLAGLLMWAAVRALAATGVLDGLASGRAARR